MLKKSPNLLNFGMIAHKTLMLKTVDHFFDIFTLRRDIGFQTWSNPEIGVNADPAKSVLPPLAQN